MNKRIQCAVLACFALWLGGCATAEVPVSATVCSDPRPQVCTREYVPVCATRHDASCGGSSCDALEKATYANACGACADPRVIFHLPNACPE